MLFSSKLQQSFLTSRNLSIGVMRSGCFVRVYKDDISVLLKKQKLLFFRFRGQNVEKIPRTFFQHFWQSPRPKKVWNLLKHLNRLHEKLGSHGAIAIFLYYFVSFNVFACLLRTLNIFGVPERIIESLNYDKIGYFLKEFIIWWFGNLETLKF